MMNSYYKLLFSLLAVFITTGLQAESNPKISEAQIKVALRIIGHDVLTASDDSTSRVLPIQNQNGRYEIAFENEFAFLPEKVVAAIDHVMAEKNIAREYIVEVEECVTNDIVYSYEFDGNLALNAVLDTTVLACGTRPQPKGCYGIYITLLDSESDQSEGPLLTSKSNQDSGGGFSNMVPLVAGFLLLMLGLVVFLIKRKKRSNASSHMIQIGAYLFDKRNMELIHKNQKIELTSKEADLLHVLYTSVNDTVERDEILKMVWEDQGDYVGRTLDVFISKLRKKLEADASIRIVNIRGVGYKLILDV